MHASFRRISHFLIDLHNNEQKDRNWPRAQIYSTLLYISLLIVALTCHKSLKKVDVEYMNPILEKPPPLKDSRSHCLAGAQHLCSKFALRSE